MLAQEPWCYDKEQIGKLTDWEIEYRYILPAIERSKQFKREGTPESPRALGERPDREEREKSTGPPGEPGSPEHRAACVDAYIRIQGLNPDRARAQYERQLAQYYAEKASGEHR